LLHISRDFNFAKIKNAKVIEKNLFEEANIKAYHCIIFISFLYCYIIFFIEEKQYDSRIK